MADPWRVAGELIQEHNDYASAYAHIKALPAFESGSHEDLAFWRQVILAIDELQRHELKQNELKH